MFPEFYYEVATPRQAEVLDAVKANGIPGMSYPKVAVRAMCIGLTAIMAMDAEELKGVMK